MDKDFVTAEQVERARAVDLLDYLKRSESGNLVHSAPGEYKLIDHDSLKISNGKFNWFSRGVGGSNAIDFLVKVRGMEFKEAVRELAGDAIGIIYSADKRAPPDKAKPHPDSPNSLPDKPNPQNDVRSFTLPEANSHNNDVVKYLIGRGVDEAIMQDCITKGLVYQSTGDNCVFVSYDGEHNPKYASERGIKSDIKKDVAGSNKAFGFCIPPNIGDTTGNTDNNINRLYVFEGAVDCLSHASIAKLGDVDWDGYRLSLGGVSSVALKTFLESKPHITEVYLALDNDKAGKDATGRIINELLGNEAYNHINLFVAPPPVGKDFNDTLVFMREAEREKHRSLQTLTGKPPTTESIAVTEKNPADNPKARVADKKRNDVSL